MKSLSIVEQRAVGQFNVSIGTSLALEGAFGIYPEEEVSPPPIHNYGQIYINVSTMIRNLFNALETQQRDEVLAKDIAPAIIEEMTLINADIENRLGNTFRVVYYINTMKSISNYFPEASMKVPTTPKQRIYHAIHDDVLKYVAEHVDTNDVNFKIFDVKLTDERSVNTLILTHSPIDLLSHSAFKSVVLLESHTGKLKPKAQWGSKFSVEEVDLPFNSFTVQVFGDHGVFISPMSIKFKRAVITLAKRDRWTPITTVAKIKSGLNTLKDIEIRDPLIRALDAKSF